MRRAGAMPGVMRCVKERCACVQREPAVRAATANVEVAQLTRTRSTPPQPTPPIPTLPMPAPRSGRHKRHHSQRTNLLSTIFAIEMLPDRLAMSQARCVRPGISQRHTEGRLRARRHPQISRLQPACRRMTPMPSAIACELMSARRDASVFSPRDAGGCESVVRLTRKMPARAASVARLLRVSTARPRVARCEQAQPILPENVTSIQPASSCF